VLVMSCSVFETVFAVCLQRVQCVWNCVCSVFAACLKLFSVRCMVLQCVAWRCSVLQCN